MLERTIAELLQDADVLIEKTQGTIRETLNEAAELERLNSEMRQEMDDERRRPS
jgi:hypothetical protein